MSLEELLRFEDAHPGPEPIEYEVEAAG